MVVGFGGGVAMLGKVLYSVVCISYKYIILIFTSSVLHLQYIMNLKPIKDLGTSIEVIYENILLLCCIIFLFVFIKLKLTLEFVNNIIIYKLKVHRFKVIPVRTYRFPSGYARHQYFTVSSTSESK